MSSIVLVSPFPPPLGGMAIQAEKIALNLEAEGWQVVKVKTNPKLSGAFSVLEQTPVLRTMVRTVYFLWLLNRGLRKAEAVLFLTGFFNFFFWVTYPALLLIFFKRKKVILSARGGGARQFFRRYGILVRPLLKRVQLIITPSGFLKEIFQEEQGLSAEIVPNIADLSQFEFRVRTHLKPHFICTRNLEPIYDVATVIRAVALIAEQFPETRLGIVGGGSQQKELEDLVAQLDLGDKVFFYGMVSHEEMPNLYAQYDIFLNGSRVDNLPGTILEAFACGLPVISTNAGGIPYMVEDGKTGLLVEVGDWRALAKKAIAVLENRGLALSLVNNGFQEVQKYRWEYVRTLLLPRLQELTNISD